MAFKEGDFLEIEYTVWDAADNKVIGTTDPKMAKEADLFDERVKYGPVLFIIGSSGVIKGMDREIRGMAVNETKKFTLKPEEAFGERIEDLVRVMPMSEFRNREINPYPGMQINLDNMTAIVKSVSAGRVVVDANHPYAGKNVIYEVRVIKQLTGDKDKVNALSGSYGLSPDVTATSDKIELKFGSAVQKNADYFVAKASLVASLFSYFKGAKEVDVKEEYIRPAEDKK